MSLELLSDHSAVKTILEQLKPPPKILIKWRRMRVHNFLPQKFESFCAISNFGRVDNGANEGSLGPEICKSVTSALTSYFGEQKCYFYYDYLAGLNGMPYLFRGVTSEVLTLFDRPESDAASPTYWWPDTQDWCFHSGYDIPYCLVGSDAGFMVELLGLLGDLAVKVDPHEKVIMDYSKDEILKRLYGPDSVIRLSD